MPQAHSRPLWGRGGAGKALGVGGGGRQGPRGGGGGQARPLAPQSRPPGLKGG